MIIWEEYRTLKVWNEKLMNAKVLIKRLAVALLIIAAVLGGVWGFQMLGQTGMPREDEQRPII